MDSISLENCRFCLSLFSNSELSELNANIRQQYFKLTHEKLASSHNLPSQICKKCLKDLKFSVQFKFSIVNNQRKLQNPTTSEQILPEAVEIKIESQEIKQEPIIVYEEDPEYLEEEYLEEFEALKEHYTEIIDQTNENEEGSLLVEIDSPVKRSRTISSVKRPKSSTSAKPNPADLQKNQCDICFKILTSSRMRAHKETVHMKIKRYECDNCAKKFYYKRSLSDHLKSELGLKTLVCQECGKMFATRGALLSHKYSFHENKYERFCELCGLRFASKIKYDTHMLAKHSNSRPYACDVEGCDKTFCAKANVYEHKQRAHTQAVECPECQKVCPSKIALRYHSRLHQPRKFECDFIDQGGKKCQKTFVTATQLKVHLNIHYDIKNYQCTECEASYHKPKYLKSHYINIHERRKIKCEFCSSMMGSKEYYRKHIIQHHKEMDDEFKEKFLAKLKTTKQEDLFNVQI